MKTPLQILMLLLSLLFVAGCSKDKNQRMDQTQVQGHLLDAATLEPIAGGRVILRKGGGALPFAEDSTTAEGYYSFNFKHDKDYIYSISAEAERYLANGNIASWNVSYAEDSPSPVQYPSKGEKNQIDIKLPPEGYVKYHFNQVEPYTGSIEVRFTPYDNLGVVSWNGQGLDKTYTSVFPGGTTYRIGYAILRNGQLDEQRYDSLFIPRFDTIIYYVEF